MYSILSLEREDNMVNESKQKCFGVQTGFNEDGTPKIEETCMYPLKIGPKSILYRFDLNQIPNEIIQTVLMASVISDAYTDVRVSSVRLGFDQRLAVKNMKLRVVFVNYKDDIEL